MAKCSLCGKRIQPYLDMCSSCHTSTFSSLHETSKVDFMETMGINFFEN